MEPLVHAALAPAANSIAPCTKRAHGAVPRYDLLDREVAADREADAARAMGAVKCIDVARVRARPEGVRGEVK